MICRTDKLNRKGDSMYKFIVKALVVAVGVVLAGVITDKIKESGRAE